MELKVIKKFRGKVEGKILIEGDTITSKDVKRINTLVSGGYCEITSLTDPKNSKSAEGEDNGEKE